MCIACSIAGAMVLGGWTEVDGSTVGSYCCRAGAGEDRIDAACHHGTGGWKAGYANVSTFLVRSERGSSSCTARAAQNHAA